MSRGGLHGIDDGKRITDDYRGHPDIAKGPDGTYYIAGNESDASSTITSGPPATSSNGGGTASTILT